MRRGVKISIREQLLGTVEINFAPFSHGLPRVSRAKAIGNGLRHLNRHLTSKVLSATASTRSSISVESNGAGGISFDDDAGSPRHFSGSTAPPSPLVNFLRDLEIDGMRIMLGDRAPRDVDALAALLARGAGFLGGQDPETPAGLGTPLAASLQRMGFEPGWGSTAARALETMEQLSDILDAPAADVVENFLGESCFFLFWKVFPSFFNVFSDKKLKAERKKK